ncbi:ADP-ribosyl cyclase/cyclic ADP-ribose hydrolase 1-like [Lampris incognitus]|uniref:ADP-ribosyl cyclase/cyclic ADP-ribose hydrolase 1-like n=1 Tax=Lampris incognitus TaxID=2546036 RepID=UPI0024B57CD5|nr:ADP-ribosyl cyclase/cyclic ADP-ribose hydrolase 1-like [Lampris incognitus]
MRRGWCWVGAGLAVVTLSIIIAVPLSLMRATGDFKSTFITKCERFPGKSARHDCLGIWQAFEQAYVGKDPCQVPVESYDHLLTTSPFEPACNRTMFWSKTKDLVHEFTMHRDCFLTAEDTLLGFILDELTWCGKEGSKETFTADCPGWTTCVHNPVRSFWKRVSAAFADVACGDVTSMLNGSITTPFSSTSIFATIEVKRLKSPNVKSLNVVLTTNANAVTNCDNASLKDLQRELDRGINYSCKEVNETKIKRCISDPSIPCRACW